MKGSLTATSSTSGHWSATLATSLPIRPKPAAEAKKHHQKSGPKTDSNEANQIRSEAELTVDADLDGSCAEHGDPTEENKK